MATIRLIPSTYSLSNTSLTVSDASNMYANTDSTNYASIGTTSTNSRYIYVKGFNFSSLPSNARVTSFTVKYKGNESSLSTSTSYRPRICNNTTTITGGSTVISTSVNTYSFTNVTATWDTISGYGANFSVRFTVRSSQNNTQGYLYLYGVEIEVNYDVPCTVTSTLTGDGTISPSGAVSKYVGETYELNITPTNSSDTITVLNNGTDVTSQLVAPGTRSVTDDTVLGTYALTSGGFNGSGGTYFSGLVGKGYDNSSQTTTNYYSSGNGTIAVFTYQTPITVPSDATITACYVMVNGHAENVSQSAEYMCVQLYSGTTALSDEYNFKSTGITSNSTQTIQATTLPTISQCANMHIQCRLGYYGGAINGATVFVTYTATVDYYTYTYTVSSDATIAVTITGGSTLPQLWWKKPASFILVSTKTNSSSSSNISSVALSPNASVGDVFRITGNITGCYYQGTQRIGAIPIETTFTYTGLAGIELIADDMTNGIVQIECSASTISLQYYYGLNQGNITGTYSVYKQGTDGGWVKVTPFHKAANSWVSISPTSPLWSSLFSTSAKYRNMDGQ